MSKREWVAWFAEVALLVWVLLEFWLAGYKTAAGGE